MKRYVLSSDLERGVVEKAVDGFGGCVLEGGTVVLYVVEEWMASYLGK